MPVDPETLDHAFDRLSQEVDAGGTAIAAVAVGDASGTVRKALYSGPGLKRHDADSIFYLASVTKPIFATAVMQVVEEGQLELHEPIARHLPEFRGDPQRERVTLWHLLTHTSGLDDGSTEMIFRERPRHDRLIARSLAAEIRFEPGSRYQYTSASFFVMEELCRRVTGEAPEDFLANRILEPLGMQHTGYDPRGRGRRIVPVSGVGANNPITRYLMVRFMVAMSHPGGGLFGTLDDLVHFGAAWLSPQRTDGGRWLPLAPETAALMGEDQLHGLPGLSDGEETSMHHGLAWQKPTLMKNLPGGPDVIDHGGASGTRLWIDPANQLVFVYFTAEWNPSREIERRTLRDVYDALGLT